MFIFDAGVAVQPFLRRLIRRVRRGEGEVEEERLGRILRLDQADGSAPKRSVS